MESIVVLGSERKRLRALTPFQEFLAFFGQVLHVNSAHYTRSGIRATIIHKGHVFEIEMRDLGPIPKVGT